ncbi:nicotinate-nucleotide adenylyltransferase [Aliiroseovarius crassostreae]|uniref:nicotinate-nucleotide adenylyltransferase n=1 Tax=Aliiroseovarius crassostreae TaxID=154981 RepID=UPI00220100E7|nr:nicotinate-nucleotide adenylyltransferase [Aliiroseovarius crassostreae]UWQ08853.1 nicotinate-nucleotide adenylyltransferase [Aliiroseovarius crassostreae]UWQ11935.1 nicotinate-nucleotide adenylyltransferase [Aliiroseovarius crassostreae]
MRHALPYAAPGQVIGLLGGSFDPAHEGHVHITREALKRFGLDRVWWLVSPGNPLKKHGPAPMDDRLRHAREVMVHPRVEVTDLERRTGTRYTAETLAALQRLYPQVRFVWLMGADNLAEFHRWDNWRWIMDHVPVGVIARPGDRVQARMSVAALIYRDARLRGRDAQRLANSKAPAWTLINAPMRDISSSQIRAKGHW